MNSAKKTEGIYAFSKPVESWLNLPGKFWIYWKDEQGNYLGCNDLLAETNNLKSREAIIGARDYELFPKQTADSFIDADKKVFNGGGVRQSFDSVIYKSGRIIQFLTTKMPLYDGDKAIKGVFGISFYVSEEKLPVFKTQLDLNNHIKNFANEAQSFNDVPERIIIKDVKLSRRESSCVYYLAKGFSAKQIASKLSICHRTVECFLERAKKKLGYRYRTELVENMFNNKIS
jgi:DNA-binding CsgD family transcriptional regulator